ncbi:MAG TPA: hypothetical protein VMG12_35150, partial [Polyangiaceae bacterium]|nr:hypothetical protein [Polyangiaceae bacterium]
QPVPGIPFDTSLYGVVHYPGDLSAGPYPLVVFLHGNHGNCRNPDTLEDVCVTRTTERCEEPGLITTPNAFGYTYLQDTLAAQGFVTLSIGANALNCRDDIDAFVLERIELVREHLRRWVAWSGAGAEPLGTQFSGAVDMSRVSLFGHSRGGAAMSGMPSSLSESPIDGVALASVFALAPTDPTSPSPSPGRFATLLPSCDGDVPRLEGAQQYDRTAFGDNPHPRAQALLVGANHNFFNTQWLVDENQEAGVAPVCSPGQLIGGPAQRAALELVLSDWVLRASDDAPLPAYMRADADTPAPFADWAQTHLDLRWSYLAPSRRVLDNFTTRSDPDQNTLGLDNSYVGFSSVDWFDSCSQVCKFPSRKQAVRVTWNAPASAHFELGDLDASDFTTLSLRFASSPMKSALDPGLLEHDFALIVRDTEGASAAVSLAELGRLAHGYPTLAQGGPQDVLSAVRVPLAELVAREPGLDTAHLAELELRFPGDGSSIGSVWLGDFELAAE